MHIIAVSAHTLSITGSLNGLVSYLVREGQRQLELVGHSLSVGPALDRDTESSRASPEGGSGKPNGAHCDED